MKKSTPFTGLVAVLLLALPATGLAYIDPYDVLMAGEPPPRPRSAEDRIAQQQADSALRRATEQQMVFGAQHMAVGDSMFGTPDEEEVLDRYSPLPDEPNYGPMPTADNSAQFDMLFSQLGDIQNQQYSLQQQFAEAQANMHSGAPLMDYGYAPPIPQPSWIDDGSTPVFEPLTGASTLAHSGVESLAAICMLMMATLGTLWRVRRMQRTVVPA